MLQKLWMTLNADSEILPSLSAILAQNRSQDPENSGRKKALRPNLYLNREGQG